jgi:hypothetical protein
MSDVDRMKAAIFIDFDNVFSALYQTDSRAGLAFAEHPEEWLATLSEFSQEGTQRAFLIRRCYINPSGGLDTRTHERIWYYKFRPYFTKAGFEVIDCPSLTFQHKNAADIRICLDILDTLGRATRYDEYVIASGDSDFTPLLQRLRAADRRITVMATTSAAAAYRGVADQFMAADEVAALVAARQDPMLIAEERTVHPDGAGAPSPFAERTDSNFDRFREIVVQSLASADGPVNQAILAGDLIKGGVQKETWSDLGGFKKAMQLIDDSNDYAFDQHFVWSRSRHTPPGQAPGEITPVGERQDREPGFIERFCAVAEVPRFSERVWEELFHALAAYAGSATETNTFSTSAAVGQTVSRLSDQGIIVSGTDVNAIVRGARDGSCLLDRPDPPPAAEIAVGYLVAAVARAKALQLTPTAGEVRMLRDWIFEGIPDEDLDLDPT